MDRKSTWELLESLADYRGRAWTRLLLWGECPGTGKSSWPVYQFGKDQCERVTLHGEMLPEDLLYSVELRPDGKGGTATVRMDGPVLRAMKLGRVLVLDEFDQHAPAVRCLLQDILNDPHLAGVTLPNGDRITPIEGFAVVATSNEAPDSLHDAIQSRFDVCVQITEPHPDAIAALPARERRLLTAHYARQEAKPAKVSCEYRKVAAFSRLAASLGDETAAALVFGDSAQEVLNALALS
jgi:MoxR-like ATPase